MKNTVSVVFCFIVACTSLPAQTPQFKTYQVDNTGYFALFPANPGIAEVTMSDNELKAYSLEVEYASEHYGLVLILLEDKFAQSDRETLQNLLISYMEFMKMSYDISSSIGYIKGQVNITNPTAMGIQDFWEDQNGLQWAVRGWVTNEALAVLYVHSDLPQSTYVPYEFLDGFVFKKGGPKTGAPIVFERKKNLK